MSFEEDVIEDEEENILSSEGEEIEEDEETMRNMEEEDDEEEGNNESGLIEGNLYEVPSALIPEDHSTQGFEGHQAPIYAVAIHPKRTTVLTGGGNDQAYLWDYQSGQVVSSFEGLFGESVSAVAFSVSGRFMAAGALDGVLRIWDERSVDGQSVEKLIDWEGQTDISWIRWHPTDENVLISGSSDGSCWVWNVENQSCEQVLSANTLPLTCGTFTSNGESILTGSSDGCLRIWETGSGKMKLKYQDEKHFHTGAINCIDVRHDVPVALTGSEEGRVKLISQSTFKILGTLEAHTDSVESVLFNSQLPYIMTAGLDGKGIIWDSRTLQQRETCEHTDGVIKALFQPGNPFSCLTVSLDGLLRIWDVRSGRCERTLHGHQDAILDFDCNSDVAVTGSDDGWALVFPLSQH